MKTYEAPDGIMKGSRRPDGVLQRCATLCWLLRCPALLSQPSQPVHRDGVSCQGGRLVDERVEQPAGASEHACF
jgi:hypothetical protein